MTDSPRIDPEQLAALLDGRVAGEARAQLLAELALSEADLEILADAAAARDAVRDMYTSHASPSITDRAPSASSTPTGPMATRSSWRRRTIWTALAAAAVIFVAMPLTRSSARAPWTLDTAIGGTVGTGPLPMSGWSEVRDGTAAASAAGRAVRIGALIADLQLAPDDSSRDLRLLALAGLLEALDGAGPIAQGVRDARAAHATPSAALLGSAARAAGDAAVAGAWIEAARIAAVREQSAFFESDQIGEALARVALVPAVDPDAARDALSALQVTLAGVPRDWRAVNRALDRLLATLAR